MKSTFVLVSWKAFEIFNLVSLLSSGKNDLSCTACQILIHAIDNFITDPSNENVVSDTLYPICGLLFANDPSTLGSCQAFIEVYTDDIIELLVNEYLKPEEVCLSLSLCPWIKFVFSVLILKWPAPIASTLFWLFLFLVLWSIM